MVRAADLPEVRGQYRENVSIAKLCWFGVGGAVDVLYKPADELDLQDFMRQLPADIPYFVLGVGSNLLVRDEGFRGVMIRLGSGFNYLNLLDNLTIESGALVLDGHLAEFAYSHGIGGLEFFCGVPGTVGGALSMNAGAYGNETARVLVGARAVTRGGEILSFTNREMRFEYRRCGLDAGHIFVSATFRGVSEGPEAIKSKMAEIQDLRGKTQPVRTKTGGSTFKNPTGQSAWKLIDKAGCRGLKIGGAQVSELHCNFFLNTGAATATDLISLICEVKRRVYDTTGVILQEEIRII